MVTQKIRDLLKRGIKGGKKMGHRKEKGGEYCDWYVSVTNNAEHRLFHQHNVGAGDVWIVKKTGSASEAQYIETYFSDQLGTDGGIDRRDESGRDVYAYRKREHTDP